MVMTSYSQRSGAKPAFAVHYRFIKDTKDVCITAPRQHVRWDFMYAGDDPLVHGVHVVWPEFIGADGAPLPEGAVPFEGVAHMFIVNPERRAIHARRCRVGLRGFFMEGTKKVADCEVIRLLDLVDTV